MSGDVQDAESNRTNRNATKKHPIWSQSELPSSLAMGANHSKNRVLIITCFKARTVPAARDAFWRSGAGDLVRHAYPQARRDRQSAWYQYGFARRQPFAISDALSIGQKQADGATAAVASLRPINFDRPPTGFSDMQPLNRERPAVYFQCLSHHRCESGNREPCQHLTRETMSELKYILRGAARTASEQAKRLEPLRLEARFLR
jgi:hypothetical protein